jgi:hypothetical protein
MQEKWLKPKAIHQTGRNVLSPEREGKKGKVVQTIRQQTKKASSH